MNDSIIAEGFKYDPLLRLKGKFKGMIEMMNKYDLKYMNELFKKRSRGLYLDYIIQIKNVINYWNKL